jgi:hypothetical protein
MRRLWTSVLAAIRSFTIGPYSRGAFDPGRTAFINSGKR